MSCVHLICGQCAGPVSEGRCPACRATRQHIHHHQRFGVSPQLIVAAILALTVLLLLATHLAR